MNDKEYQQAAKATHYLNDTNRFQRFEQKAYYPLPTLTAY